MATKIYVGNLNDQTGEEELEQLFRPYGKVSTVEVITGLGGGGSGFAFVEMLSADAAKRAVAELNGRLVHNHVLRVNETSVEEEVVGPRSGGYSTVDFH